ncbi:MAG: hypothetical protein QF584_02805, partial [Candidatus Woesearchaeota archaeon]|nr:hypothetical protein [Candidatus Woesearchaeota archaeon]
MFKKRGSSGGSMKKGVIVAMLLFFLLVMGTAFSGNHDNNKNNEKVDSEVEDLLEQVDEVSVIVVLEDDYDVLNEYSVSSLNEMDEFEKKKA